MSAWRTVNYTAPVSFKLVVHLIGGKQKKVCWVVVTLSKETLLSVELCLNLPVSQSQVQN